MTFHSVFRGLIGIAFLLAVGWLCSRNRKAIPWGLVFKALLLQLVIAGLALRFDIVSRAFDNLTMVFLAVLSFSKKGAEFVFGNLVNVDFIGFIFAFQILPTIVFFSALTSLLYYLNILQYVVFAFAWVMKRFMRLSGAESLAAAANIFVGQTEAPLVVKPYIEKMTRSEMLCLMCGGMATIAGGVLAAYIGFLGGTDEATRMLFGKHLLMASIISAPAAVLAAKMLLPETETINEDLFIPRHSMGSNMLDAISQGTTQGVKLAVNVGAMLLVFTALVALANQALFHLVGAPTGLNEVISKATEGRYEGLTFQVVLGYLFAPVAWLLGVPNADLVAVGQLLGEKTVINEFYAYSSMGVLKSSGVLTNERSIIIATYALCGFANFASIGIQIGGIGALAPGRRVTLSQLGILALLGGTMACFFTACIAGIFVG